MSANFRHLFQCGGVIQDRLTKFKPILHAPARDYVVDGGKGEAVMGQVAVLHPFIVRKQASKVNKTLDQYPLVWYNYLCRFFGATFLIVFAEILEYENFSSSQIFWQQAIFLASDSLRRIVSFIILSVHHFAIIGSRSKRVLIFLFYRTEIVVF